MSIERLAAHLAHKAMPVRCELAGPRGYGRCEGEAVAVKWESGFADFVCEEHAASAEERGAVVVRASRHDGSVAPALNQEKGSG